MQTDDFSWYKDNLKSLYSAYGDTFLLIKDKHVHGTFDSYAQAVKQGEKELGLGSFIVQKSGPDDNAYTIFIG